ncbi:hypothetical protein MKW98_001722 [Papaver atlanticum]|uniref:RING-type E3 ubiquitin transferase n=1 Tax=Papaver atlanticum TaxID=357466 RepID=A0AAD4X9Y5_9MAGN|nr:hypothetical protein MKW98_001722 [Papaver atlanticum]
MTFTKSINLVPLLLVIVLLTPPYNYGQSDSDAHKNNKKSTVKYEVLSSVVIFLVLASGSLLILFVLFKIMSYLDERRNYNDGAAAATTQGLDQSAAAAAQGLKQSAAALQMLPVLVYSDFQKKDHHTAAGTEKKECAICLVEFRDNDKLTLLPCKHVYHSHCVGTWFISKTTCPLCRTDLISVVVADMV